MSGSRLHHLALQVTDLDAARAFYVGVLGFVVTREQSHSLWLDAGGVILMLERCAGPIVDDPWPSDRPGPFVVAFAMQPHERESWLKQLAQADVVVDHATAFTIYFRDPFGARLALSHYPNS